MKQLSIVLLFLIPALTMGQQGAWETPSAFVWGPNHPNFTGATRAINLVLTWNGSTAKVLSLSFDTPDSRLWTSPLAGGAPGTFEPADHSSFYFCGGHSALADGQVLHAGGGVNPQFALKDANLFNPGEAIGNQWNNPVAPPYMEYKRWYPTLTTLEDGTVLGVSGLQCDPAAPPCPQAYARIPELYTPYDPADPLSTNNWTPLPNLDRQQDLYPYMFLLPSGNLIDAGPAATRILVRVNAAGVVLPPGSWVWGQTVDPPLEVHPTPAPGLAGSAAM